MNEISIGAVGAAVIAGLVSVLGLIIAKEQKVSEFRQAWIDELRDAMVAYLVHINAIGDALRLKSSGKQISDELLLSSYKSLNESSHNIMLRVNEKEDASRKLLKNMAEFEVVASNNSTLNPAAIGQIEGQFLDASRELLKFEWTRVKRGEGTFVWTKRIVLGSIVAMLMLLGYTWMNGTSIGSSQKKLQVQLVHLHQWRPDYGALLLTYLPSSAPG